MREKYPRKHAHLLCIKPSSGFAFGIKSDPSHPLLVFYFSNLYKLAP